MPDSLSPLGQQLVYMSSEHLAGQSIDCVVFGFRDSQLHVLLLKWRNLEVWALPGGFIQVEEDIDQAALRVLKDRTGLDDVFLKQFHTFGSANRRQADQVIEYLEQQLPDGEKQLVHFLRRRFTTTGYLALIRFEEAVLSPDILSERCEWVPLDQLPSLLLDHHQIIERALDTIRIQLSYLPIGYELLPEKFTISQLMKLYEAMLGRSLDRGNFQRKMLRLGHLIRLEKRQSGQAHRAPYLYRFNLEKYNELKARGIGYL